MTTSLFHLVNSGHHGPVGSASAWQTRGRVFEPALLMRYISSGKYPGAQRASCCFFGLENGLGRLSLSKLSSLTNTRKILLHHTLQTTKLRS